MMTNSTIESVPPSAQIEAPGHALEELEREVGLPRSVSLLSRGSRLLG